jgi:hypothetical protein
LQSDETSGTWPRLGAALCNEGSGIGSRHLAPASTGITGGSASIPVAVAARAPGAVAGADARRGIRAFEAWVEPECRRAALDVPIISILIILPAHVARVNQPTARSSTRPAYRADRPVA